MEKEEIEAKARKMFPIGTKFFPAHLDTMSKSKDYVIVTTNNLEWFEDNLHTLTKNNKTFDNNNNPEEGSRCYNKILYSKGKFAKVLSIKQNNYELWEK